MDKEQATNHIIARINQYQTGEISVEVLMEDVCQYFDLIKGTEISEADKQLLFFIANIVGVPQYYDMLSQTFQKDTTLELIGLDTLASSMREASLYVSSGNKIHRYQKEVLNKFHIGEKNRYFLTATTSFGKTYLVYEVLQKMQYTNAALIFPTIALLSENLEKIYTLPEYSWIREKYRIHTLSKIQEYGDCNLFLYTPERFLSYTDTLGYIRPNFVFVDEAYKLDNDYLIDEESQENERDVAYRLCINQSLLSDIDILLAGPFIKRSQQVESFANFLRDNRIKWLDYNAVQIVGKQRLEIKTKQEYTFASHTFHFPTNKRKDKLVEIIKTLLADNENVIVYCKTKPMTESVAELLLSSCDMPVIENERLTIFVEHLKHLFKKSDEWIVTRAIERGIGVHHGLVPKYIQKELIDLFNQGILKVLAVTTTVTEGVNTTAKNVVITSRWKGDKELKPFDALNIEGRAGRFLKHYSGNVIIFADKYETDVRNKQVEPIKHKNYDLSSPKSDVDLYFTKEQYLQHDDILKRQELDAFQRQYGIPEEVMSQFKIVSKRAKISMYHILAEWNRAQFDNVRRVIQRFAAVKRFDFDDFEVIVSATKSIIPTKSKLYGMMARSHTNGYSLFTNILYAYLTHGLYGSIGYYVDRGEDVDDVVRRQSEFVFSTLKYDAVKYFGVFNLMYKCLLSQRNRVPLSEITGIDSILQAMEYNVWSPKGMIAMDYGVPLKVVDFYEKESIEEKKQILDTLDDYEKQVLEKIDRIIG